MYITNYTCEDIIMYMYMYELHVHVIMSNVIVLDRCYNANIIKECFEVNEEGNLK